MSQENVEIVRCSGEAFDRGDYQAALDALDPEVEYDLSHFPEGRVYHGHEGVRESFRIWLGTWEDYHQERVEIIDADDRSSWSCGSAGAERGAVWRSFARAMPCGRCAMERPYESVSIPAKARPSKPPGCRTDESQVPWTIFLPSAIVAFGAGDDELKRRFRG